MFGNNRHQSNLGERVNERIANLFSRPKVSRYSLYDKAKASITNLWNTTDFFPVRNAREYTRERHVIQYDNVYYSHFVVQGVNKLLSEAHYLSHAPYRIPIRLNSKAEFDRHDYKAEFGAYLDRNPAFLRSKIEEKRVVENYVQSIHKLHNEWNDTVRRESIDPRIVSRISKIMHDAKRKYGVYNQLNTVHLHISYTSPAGQNKYRKDYVLNAHQTSELIQRHMRRAKRRSEYDVRRARERNIPVSLRLYVFNRDGYTCQLCRDSEANGAPLELDHIYPHAKGGLDLKPNLWTLCRPCNRGKGDKIIDFASVKTPPGFEKYLYQNHGIVIRRQSIR